MFVDWQPRYSVGVPAMDAAHKKIMALMNRLHEQRSGGEDKAALRATLKELTDFTVRHFREEEGFMESIAFPALANHKQIHATLIQQLGQHVNAFETGKGALPDQFFNFLKVWLTSHIVGIDGKYGEHAHKRP